MYQQVDFNLDVDDVEALICCNCPLPECKGWFDCRQYIDKLKESDGYGKID